MIKLEILITSANLLFRFIQKRKKEKNSVITPFLKIKSTVRMEGYRF